MNSITSNLKTYCSLLHFESRNETLLEQNLLQNETKSENEAPLEMVLVKKQSMLVLLLLFTYYHNAHGQAYIYIYISLQENTNLTTAKIVVISSEKKAYEEMAMKGVSSLYDCRKRRFVAISSLISEVIFSS